MREQLLKLKIAWGRFATRTRIRNLPAAPAVVAVVFVGLMVPLAVAMNRKPTQLSPQLAVERLERFCQRHAGEPLESGPSGDIVSARPAFFWPAHERAARYSFTLSRGDTVVMSNDGVVGRYVRMKAPGALDAGATYRFEVKAIDERGDAVADWNVTHTFTVRPSQDLQPLHELIQMELSPAEGAFVLMGFFADKDSADDVVSALIAWKTDRGEQSDLAEGTPAGWISKAADCLSKE